MKRILKFFSLFIVIVVLVLGCGNNKSKEHLIDISYDELNKKIANNDTFILEIVQDGCQHCSNFTPVFTSVLEEYDLTAYSINIYVDKIGSANLQEFLNTYGQDLGTPTVIFFEDGKETSTMQRIEGEKSKNQIVSKLKTNGYIKE